MSESGFSSLGVFKGLLLFSSDFHDLRTTEKHASCTAQGRLSWRGGQQGYLIPASFVRASLKLFGQACLQGRAVCTFCLLAAALRRAASVPYVAAALVFSLPSKSSSPESLPSTPPLPLLRRGTESSSKLMIWTQKRHIFWRLIASYLAQKTGL